MPTRSRKFWIHWRWTWHFDDRADANRQGDIPIYLGMASKKRVLFVARIAHVKTAWHIGTSQCSLLMGEPPDSEMKTCTLDEARAAKAEAANAFGLLASVVGVGITRVGEGYGLKINLRQEAKSPLPTEVAGVPVHVEVVGPIQKR
jgi:hypothetical protein